jgi:rubredoxin
LTERVEVCGRNCGNVETRGVEVKSREVEQGFRPNMRDLDARWLCPCCGIEREKGRKCVSVLDFDVGGYWGRRV